MLALSAALALAGCASQPKYACGVPEGVTCMPVSEVYQRSVSGALPSRPAPRGTEAGEAAQPPAPAARQIPVVATVKPGAPVLEAPKPVRVWVNRWVDRDGDLHDETYLYLRPRGTRWRLGGEPAGEGA